MKIKQTKRTNTPGGRRPDTNGKSSSAGEKIIAGLTELCDALGSGAPLHHRFTVRTVVFDFRPRDYAPADVKRVRDTIGVSQPVLAAILGVGASTVRGWEQGIRSPSPMARRFLDEIAASPDHWKERLRKAAVSKNVE